MALEQLLKQATKSYTVIKCETPELIRICQELRHQIYCEEKGWELLNHEQREYDEYEDISIHYLIKDVASDKFVATFRLMFGKKLPFMNFIDNESVYYPMIFSGQEQCEISRFSVLKDYRNPILRTLLIKVTALEAVRHKFSGVYMVVERSLAKNISKAGIPCNQLTNLFEYHGKRAVFFCSMTDMLKVIVETFGDNIKDIETGFKPVCKFLQAS